MTHKRRVQTNKFECGHKGLGKYCHRCKDEKAGKLTPRKRARTWAAVIVVKGVTSDPSSVRQKVG